MILVNGRSIAFMEPSFRSENERFIVGMLGPLNSFVGPSGAVSAASLGERNINGKPHPGPFLRRLGEGACEDVDRCAKNGDLLTDKVRGESVETVQFESLSQSLMGVLGREEIGAVHLDPDSNWNSGPSRSSNWSAVKE